MESRTLSMIKICLLSVIAVSLVLILVVLLYKPSGFEFFNISTKSELVYDKEFTDEIKNLNISSVSSDIKIENSDIDTVTVKVYGKDDENIKVEVKNGTLSINEEIKSFCFGFCYYPDYQIIVTVPSNIEYDVKLNTTSGEISVGDILTSNLKINTISGDIDVKNHNKLSIEGVSGDLNIGEVGEISAKTVSGEININKVSGKCDIKTTSGDVEIDVFDPKSSSKIVTVSGDIELHKNTSYINVNTVSGDIDILNNNRYANVETSIKTTSGDVSAGE